MKGVQCIIALCSVVVVVVEAVLNPITVIETNGSVVRGAISAATSDEGDDSTSRTSSRISIVTSPGSVCPLLESLEVTGDGVKVLTTENYGLVVTAPGATVTGTSSMARGNGAASASIGAGCIVLSGTTVSDIETLSAFRSTRLGYTLSSIFRARLSQLPSQSSTTTSTSDVEEGSDEGNDEEDDNKTPKCLLILTIPTDTHTDYGQLLENIEGIYKSVQLGFITDHTDEGDEFLNHFIVKIEVVQDDATVDKVMTMATNAAEQYTAASSDETSSTSAPSTVLSISRNYSKLSSIVVPPLSLARAMLVCDDSYTRSYKMARAKLTSWSNRVTQRGLLIDNFGMLVKTLYEKAMATYDKETIIGSGSIRGAPYRMELRSKLEEKLQRTITTLYHRQVELLQASTISSFESDLLRNHDVSFGKEEKVGETFYDDNASLLEQALLGFENTMSTLEVPLLSLMKPKATAEMKVQLNTALLEFPDSPKAKLKELAYVEKMASKELAAKQEKKEKSTERNMNLGLDLVAMIRPDGFGNFQGFAGYTAAPNMNIIVGVHNDADSPDVIAQFGGTRPSFVRIQPKLKVEVEL